MKTIMQIAMSCDTTYEKVRQAIKHLRLVNCFSFEKKKRYNDYQIELIYQHLYYLGAVKEVIIESKLNDHAK